MIGAIEAPSPVTSVVIPWVIFDAARPSTSTLYSDWPSRSMKPGAITRPVASTTRFALAPSSRPMAAMRPSRTATSAANHGAPVPSTTRPPRSSRS
jgi:hypothetical protein